MSADTVTLKDGRAITGTYLGGSTRVVKIEAGGQIETLDVETMSRIDFAKIALTWPSEHIDDV